MSDRDIQAAIEKLAYEGHIEEEWDSEDEELKYSMTDSGLAYAEEMIREDDDAALFLFGLMWNGELDGEWPDSPEKKFLKIAETFRDEIGLNIVRVLKRNGGAYEGGPKIGEDAPEEFLEKFDPDEDVNTGDGGG